MKKKLIIAGGRHQRLSNQDIGELNSLVANHNISEIVSGGTTGIDVDGEAFAKNQNISIVRFSADWQKHGKAAGPIRNRKPVLHRCTIKP